MTHTRLAELGLAVLTAGACASSLKTLGEDGKPTLGIPVATAALVRITETTTFEVNPANPGFGGYCTDETSSRYDILPVGDRIYVTFDPAAFGKGEFKLELAPSGALKLVSLNSDATAGADKVGELPGTVLPYTAAPKPEGAAESTVSEGWR